MKNKILLTVVFASLGFAIYALFSNLQKKQNQICFYEGTSVSSVRPNNNVWNSSSPSIQKKKSNRRNTAENRTSNTVNFDSRKSKGKTGFLDTSVPDDLSFGNSSANHSRNRKEEISITSDMGSSGMLLTEAGNGRKNGKAAENFNTFVASDYSSSVAAAPSTFMGAPTDPATTDDIIIDPGGDPNPEDIIPVGEGQIALILLALGYGLFIAIKKKLA